MRILVVYDSSYGNTEAVAKVIGEAVGGDTAVLPATQTAPANLASAGLLIVGTPTQGGKPTPAIMELLGGLPPDGLAGVRVAAFDTRFAAADHGLALQLLMRVIGYAAPRIARTLQAKGGSLVAPPEGFIVQGKEGPLKEGELQRATSWMTTIAESLN